MREILFRGKMDNGEWVYGSFCMDVLEQFNGLCGVDGFIRLYDKAEGKMKTYEVDRETVGQYTGLKDKHGKRIFEGDILSLRTGRRHVVMFEDGAFALENTAITMRFANKFEVIGNIHDNPEMLKGGDG